MIRNNKNKVRIFKTIELLNEAAAQLIVALSEKSIKERGRFVFCLSGGNTPKKLYTLLSQKPYRDIVPWKHTFVFWSDERCVPTEDERNNANMASTLLLKKIDIPPSNIFPIPVQKAPALSAKKYEDTLRNFFGNDPAGAGRFDLILLGLGENGHTASLFPGTEVLHEKSGWVKEVYVEEQQMNRITLTAPLINQARQVLFLVTGEKKSHILETVLTGAYLPEKYPAQLIEPEYGEVQWFVDEKAASRLYNS